MAFAMRGSLPRRHAALAARAAIASAVLLAACRAPSGPVTHRARCTTLALPAEMRQRRPPHPVSAALEQRFFADGRGLEVELLVHAFAPGGPTPADLVAAMPFPREATARGRIAGAPAEVHHYRGTFDGRPFRARQAVLERGGRAYFAYVSAFGDVPDVRLEALARQVFESLTVADRCD